MLMDKKKNPAALMIVSQMDEDYHMEDDYKMMDESDDNMLELAAYRMSDAANLHISDMKCFLEAFKMFHHYLHEEIEEEDPWPMK